jgi:UDP-glucose 4-epimerase
MKCLVFGASGYIGKHISYILEKEGHYLGKFDASPTSDDINKVDVTDITALESINYDIDYIFWLVGLVGTLDSYDNAGHFIDVNEKSLVSLLNILRVRGNRPRIIFPSTRLVYKGVDQALTEIAEKAPKTIYAINKMSCEYLLESYYNLYNIPYTIYRICVPYGDIFSNGYSYGTIGFFVNKAQEGENIVLYGDGELKRTFTHIYDVCYQILLTCVKKETEAITLNIGGENLSLKQVAQIIASNYGVNVDYVKWPEQAFKLESGHTYFDDTAIQSLLGKYEYRKIEEQKWK